MAGRYPTYEDFFRIPNETGLNANEASTKFHKAESAPKGSSSRDGGVFGDGGPDQHAAFNQEALGGIRPGQQKMPGMNVQRWRGGGEQNRPGRYRGRGRPHFRGGRGGRGRGYEYQYDARRGRGYGSRGDHFEGSSGTWGFVHRDDQREFYTDDYWDENVSMKKFDEEYFSETHVVWGADQQRPTQSGLPGQSDKELSDILQQNNSTQPSGSGTDICLRGKQQTGELKHNDVLDSSQKTQNQTESDQTKNSSSYGQAKEDNKGEDQREDDDNDSSEEDTTFCKLCDVHFDCAQKYYRHTRGLLHTQRQMFADQAKGKTHSASSEKAPEKDKSLSQSEQDQPTVNKQKEKCGEEGLNPSVNHDTQEEHVPKSVAEMEEEDEEEWFEEDWRAEIMDSENLFVCELCDIRTTGAVTLEAHMNGRNHKLVQEACDSGTSIPLRVVAKLGPKAMIPERLKPSLKSIMDGGMVDEPMLPNIVKKISEAVVGLEYVKEGRSGSQAAFFCKICESSCDTSAIKTHIVGSKHRLKYLRSHYPEDYERLKGHTTKKSQMSAILETLCSDIQSGEKFRQPMMDSSSKAPNVGKIPDEKVPTKKQEEKDHERTLPQASDRRKFYADGERQRMYHDPVMARRGEDRRYQDMEDSQKLMRPGHERWRGSPPDPFSSQSGRDGPRGSRPPPFDPGFEKPFDPYFDRPVRHNPYPPFRDHPPEPFITEEDSRRRMLEYERHLFYYPDIGISPEEARHRMFIEYERIGVPYEVACDRVVIQEVRRMALLDYMRDGMTLEEAQKRVTATENRKQLIREYVEQGLDPHEARSRVIVEEERNKLMEQYERQGITPLQARAKIMAGHDRMHLIREFERHGMPPEEARRRALNEEDRLKNLEQSLKTRIEQEQTQFRLDPLDEIADKQMLESFMQLGDTREQAENKVIAALRRQGVSTQEAIIRAQKVKVDLPERSDRHSPSCSRDEHTGQQDCSRGLPTDYDHNKPGPSKSVIDYDKITPEEAKERLFQEYEKRGVPREQARIALIQELIRSGVSPEEAERRFRDVKTTESSRRGREFGGEKGRKNPKYTGYDRSRSCSSSSSGSSRSKSGHRDRRRRSKSRRSDYRADSRERDRFPERREEDYSRRHERSWRSRDSSPPDRRERSRQQSERKGRPTLTLGEELKLKARKLKREYPDRREDITLPFKQHRSSPSTSAAHTYSGSSTTTRPSSSDLSNPEKSHVSSLLESLTDSLISSEDDMSMAMKMSKALTSALLKYRLNADPNEVKPTGSVPKPEFVERRIEDAKKLFEKKMLPQQEKQFSGSHTDKAYRKNQTQGRSSAGREMWEELESQERPRVVRRETYRPSSPQIVDMQSRRSPSRLASDAFDRRSRNVFPNEDRVDVPRIRLTWKDNKRGRGSVLDRKI